MKTFPLSKEELKELIELLQLAEEQGYSTLSPPLVPMLEICIDLNLRIAEFFKEGGPLNERTNPSLKEFDYADALGNSKMIKIFELPKWVHEDPEISKFFRELAESYVLFKRTGRISSFMEKNRHGPSAIKDQSKMVRKKRPQSRGKQPKTNSYWFFRRRKARIRYKKHILTKSSD